jgi:hypothetical protein
LARLVYCGDFNLIVRALRAFHRVKTGLGDATKSEQALGCRAAQCPSGKRGQKNKSIGTLPSDLFERIGLTAIAMRTSGPIEKIE